MDLMVACASITKDIYAITGAHSARSTCHKKLFFSGVDRNGDSDSDAGSSMNDRMQQIARDSLSIGENER